MSVTVPITRSSRRTQLAAADGQTVFTFTSGPVWDTADLMVYRRIAPATNFTRITTGFALAKIGDGTAGATCTFAVAPKPTGGDPAVDIRIDSRRTQESAVSAARSGKISAAAIDALLDRIATTQQELRRDVGTADIGETLEDHAGLLALAAYEVASRTALAALSGSRTPVVSLTEAGREGLFVWSSANLSAQVTADPGQGLYVAPATDYSGGAGAWVRRWDGVNANPKWWGVKADGATDDQTAVQRAINSAAPVLWWPSGTMSIQGTGLISGVSNQTWHGVPGATVFRLDVNPAGDFVAFINKQYVVMDGVTIDWNNKTAAGLNGALGMASCSFFTIRKNRIINIDKFGILATGLQDSEIYANRITKATAASTQNNAILLSSAGRQCTRVWVRDNYMFRSGLIANCSYSYFINNRATQWKYGAGIALGYDSTPGNVYGYNVIAGNILHGSSGLDADSTYPAGIENWSYYTTITGNVCYDNSGCGIANGGEYNTVTGNVCYNNGTSSGGAGIASTYTTGHSAFRSVYSGNLSFSTAGVGAGTQTYGYSELGGFDFYCTVEGNSFFGNKNGAISLSGSTTSYRAPTLYASTSVTPGTVANGTPVTADLTVPNAVLGDLVTASFSLALGGVQLTAWVVSANTVRVMFVNPSSAGPISLGAGTVNVRVEKHAASAQF
jgi:hypothetical protein